MSRKKVEIKNNREEKSKQVHAVGKKRENRRGRIFVPSILTQGEYQSGTMEQYGIKKPANHC